MVDPVYGRWGPTEVMERVLDGTWAEVVDGMGLIQPESITYSGTSAAITGLGSVEFEAVSSLSLNGVFSSDFDNYMIVMRHDGTSAGDSLWVRNRASGSDATAANYVSQILIADGSTVSGVRLTSQTAYRMGSSWNNLKSGLVCYSYGPALAQPTAFRSVAVEADSSVDDARVYDVAGTHSLSTAYDGITIYPNSGSMNGLVTVYGLAQ
jgi:hypothetical protein